MRPSECRSGASCRWGSRGRSLRPFRARGPGSVLRRGVRAGNAIGPLVGDYAEAGALGANVDVRAGSFAGRRLPEGEVRDTARLEVPAQPDTLRLIGVQRHVDAAAVIEAQGAVDGGLAHGADGQRFREAMLESGGNLLKLSRREDARAIVADGGRGAAAGALLSRLAVLLGEGHLDKLMIQIGARHGEVVFLARVADLLDQRRQVVLRRDAGLDEAAHSVELLLTAVEAALGGCHHLIGLLLGDVLAVHSAAQDGHILR